MSGADSKAGILPLRLRLFRRLRTDRIGDRLRSAQRAQIGRLAQGGAGGSLRRHYPRCHHLCHDPRHCHSPPPPSPPRPAPPPAAVPPSSPPSPTPSRHRPHRRHLHRRHLASTRSLHFLGERTVSRRQVRGVNRGNNAKAKPQRSYPCARVLLYTSTVYTHPDTTREPHRDARSPSRAQQTAAPRLRERPRAKCAPLRR
jgi:hypothetical protein